MCIDLKVVDKTTNTNRETCDFVRCNNCDIIMLVDNGIERCPCCNYQGALMWEQDGYEEIIYDNAGDILSGLEYNFSYKESKHE